MCRNGWRSLRGEIGLIGRAEREVGVMDASCERGEDEYDVEAGSGFS